MLCGTAHRALGLLGRLLADMGDLTRLHAGAVETYLRPVGIDEVVEAALDDLGPGGRHIGVRIDEDTPDVITDAALLSRMLTSLMADSLHRSPPASTPGPHRHAGCRTGWRSASRIATPGGLGTTARKACRSGWRVTWRGP